MSQNSISFSNATLKKLEQYFKIEIEYREDVFADWFGFEYAISEREAETLTALQSKHRLKLPAYSEEKLKAKFIAAILNLVDFYVGQLDDWYEVELRYDFESLTLNGLVDYLVAKGSDLPKIPFFFLQEFKYTFPDKDPRHQLLAQMIVAIALNQEEKMRGGFVVGSLWYFALLQKEGELYRYYISPSFDALSQKGMFQIFTYLQAVKADALARLNSVKD